MAEGLKRVEGDSVPPARRPYSPAVVWDNMVFVSGILALDPEGNKVTGGIREESMVVLRNLRSVLEAAGSGLGKVLSATIFLADIADLAAFNEVYEEFFEPPYPARAGAGVSLPAGFSVEVSAVAYRD